MLSLHHDRRGVAAIEFAMVLPVMVLFIIAVFDVSKAMILNQQVYNAAHTIPILASIQAVQTDKSTSLSAAQVQQSMSAIYAEMPWIRAGIEAGTRSVTMTSVVFQPTAASCVSSPTVTCTYAPHVAWSVPYSDSNAQGFKAVLRACGTLNQTTATKWVQSDLTSLPTTGLTLPDPILVVDVHYQYLPIFFNFLTGPVDFWSSGLWPVRSVAPNTALINQYTTYDLANQASGVGGQKCQGYD